MHYDGPHPLGNVIRLLQSRNVRDSGEGLIQIEEALANEAKIDQITHPTEWIAIFEALSGYASRETATCLKKGWDKAAPVSLRRLEKVGSVFRNGIERCASRFNYTVVSEVVKYLLKGMVDKGGSCLVKPLALNYIKALVGICRHSQHLEHFADDLWVRSVSLGFAVVLNDDLASVPRLDKDTDGSSDQEDSMGMADSDAEEDADDDVPVGSKRARRGSPGWRHLQSGRAPGRTLSAEQIEFTSLLVILFRSPHAPYLKDQCEETKSPQSFIAQRIFNRLFRFFEMYTSWSVAHTNIIISINVVLSEVELSMTKQSAMFALKLWSHLLSYWGGKERKDKVVKEELLISMMTFLPLITMSSIVKDPSNIVTDRLDELFTCLEDDISGGTFDSLHLDSLRLQHLKQHEKASVFEGMTFRSGTKFEHSQALTWGFLELHADCAVVLHNLMEGSSGQSETVVTQSTGRNGTQRKRRRRLRNESPLDSIIKCIAREENSLKLRSDTLQVLMFIIDRHWSDLHANMQCEIIKCLSSLITQDETSIQSWGFLCLAAILAYPETTFEYEIDWHSIWLQAIHRVNGAVGRSASHVAHIMLATQRLPLQKIIPDIESFATNLIVQGPPFPFDSTCAFLRDCLHIASQDMRLYRIYLPDKIVGWLVQNWNVVSWDLRNQLTPHLFSDVLALLEEVCGLSKRSNLKIHHILPDGVITDVMIERLRTAEYRRFLLQWRLPPFRSPTIVIQNTCNIDSTSTGILSNPDARESKVSEFLLTSLARLTEEWPLQDGVPVDPTPEKLRRTIDIIVLSLCWEAVLVNNGVGLNRKVINAACNLMIRVTPCLNLPKWKPNEITLFLAGLDPLVFDGETSCLDDPWDIVSGPGKASGIPRNVLVKLLKDPDADRRAVAFRREIQTTIWKRDEVQEAFKGVMTALESVVTVVSASEVSGDQLADEDEDFGPIQILDASHSHSRAQASLKDHCIQLSVSFLAVAQMLQSADEMTYGTPGSMADLSRNPRLLDMILQIDVNHEPEAFLRVAPHILECVRKRQLHIYDQAVAVLAKALTRLATKLYQTTGSVRTRILVMQFLYSTSHLWTDLQDDFPRLSRAVRTFHDLLRQWFSEDSMPSWKIRDYFICYLDYYLKSDPDEDIWSLPVMNRDGGVGPLPDAELLPSHILPDLTDDTDARIRLRVSVANARLLASNNTAYLRQVYAETCQRLTIYADRIEDMLTRFMYLINAMITSSQMRPKAYWRLVEVDLYDDVFTPVLMEILSAATSRLGFPNLRILFESYASQFAGSLVQRETDISKFHPCLFGYETEEDLASSTFALIAPELIITGRSANQYRESALQLFATHCMAARKTQLAGTEECFPRVVAMSITTSIQLYNEHEIDEAGSQAILSDILAIAQSIAREETPEDRIRRQMDRIVYEVVRSLADTDYTPNGAIAVTLSGVDAGKAAEHRFLELNRYRCSTDFITHEPNLPFFHIHTIVQALQWLEGNFGSIREAAISYHIIHYMSADLEKSVLINEQLRLLQAMTVWISLCGDAFTHDISIRALIRTVIPTLGQFDLAHLAQGVLEWALSTYQVALSSELTEASIPTFLSRIAGICYDYSCQRDDADVSAMGDQLLTWIEEKLASMYKKRILGHGPSIGDSTLPLWPRAPDRQLAELHKYSSSVTSDILANPYTASSKFRLVRHLSRFIEDDTYPQDRFCTRDFWYLKHSIPSPEEIQDEDIDGFIRLLFKYSPYIQTPAVDVHLSNAIFALHTREVMGIEAQKVKVKPKLPLASLTIVNGLFQLLSSGIPSKANHAYDTLRRIFSHSDGSNKGADAAFKPEIPFLLENRPLRLSTDDEENFILSDLQVLGVSMISMFPSWICQLARILCTIVGQKEVFYAQLRPFAASDPSFAEEIIPILVYQTLTISIDNARTAISEFFTSILQTGHETASRVVVNTVLYLRHFHPVKSVQDPLAYDRWLDIDYHLLSQAAMLSGAYTTALLFLELAREYSDSSEEYIPNEDILYSIYSRIEEPDGFYGIQSKDIRGFLSKRFYHEGQWDLAFQFHNAGFAAGQEGHSEGIYQSLHSNGLDALGMTILQSHSGRAQASENPQLAYELAWRSQVWDLPDPRDGNERGAPLYVSLRAIHRNREQEAIEQQLKQIIQRQLHELSLIGDEDMIGIRSKIQTLLCLGEIRRLKRIVRRDQLHPSVDMQEVISNLSSDFEFTTLESIMAARMSLIRSTLRLEQMGNQFTPFGVQLRDLERKCLLRLSEAARFSGRQQIALNATTRAQNLEETPSFEVSEEFASVLWTLKQHRPAVDYMRQLIKQTPINLGNINNISQRSLALSRLGTWIAEACLQKATDIRMEFFEKAATLLLGTPWTEEPVSHPKLAVVFHQYALFSESQYHALRNSPELVRLRVYEERMKAMKAGNISEDTLPSRTRRWYVRDAEELRAHKELQAMFLYQAIEMYSRALQGSDEFDDNAILHLCSLWFANFEKDATDFDHSRFETAFGRIQSRKLLLLSRQLCARLSDSKETPQLLLQHLVRQMCVEHPFHSLYHLWVMHEPKGARTSKPKDGNGYSPGISRGKVAREILHWCREQQPHGQRVRDIDVLCKAYLEWAKFSTKQDQFQNTGNGKKDRQFKAPAELRIRKIRNLAVPVTTANTPVDPSLKYDNIVTIQRYTELFEIADGNATPKIHECIGSDGNAYRQLFKGEGADDLRQDAVMMQVFELVDMFLKKDRETRRRSLGIRCYKVIPLDSQSGLIEFVKDTTVLRNWLSPAHRRYRPQDITDPGKEMRKWRVGGKGPALHTLEVMREKFLALRQRFKPVFRHFFTEKHKLPLSWFATRLKYTRSAAATSIAGHILGLGDRHVSNILIDNTTGELVHIDLGIAFDQGQLLGVPELVPFRLTGDMVDGFGMTGTEGVFRRCAEETLRVLREQHGVIITILEVFRQDPLHSWTMDSAKKRKVQGDNRDAGGETAATTTTTTTKHPGAGKNRAPTDPGDDETDILYFNTVDESADRAISGVRRKLDQSLSVEHTVNELITTAKDPGNMAMIFAGWSPWF
ncbi:hypothetical protein M422DRAFT_220613 [Sphaerobolus stellatus SS14]|nr:hypothetical protein M422DRAFT_220613 [Sphaerobolus stellatus SS14]